MELTPTENSAKISKLDIEDPKEIIKWLKDNKINTIRAIRTEELENINCDEIETDKTEEESSNYCDSENTDSDDETSVFDIVNTEDDKKMSYIKMLENYIALSISIRENAYTNINDDSFHDGLSALNRVAISIMKRKF